MNKSDKTVQTAKDIKGTIVKELEPMKEIRATVNLPVIFTAVAIVLLGVVTGYLLSKNQTANKSGAALSGGKNAQGLAKVVGLKDEKTFKDSAEGTLRSGGIDGEGSHNLERPGGPSQTVYLTSSTVPLDDYVDKKVKVWGETFAAEKAGWFMDVGRLELLE